ncbi:hypothetical protein O6H91_13G014100 [Diphasiastrum complanatum]|uniref:Uncharacterized protein n=1 Tax=Diphasiastrum complanatum TaxID=34168 RepID=A0ACC2BS99_DIPCM|nr:hypothetical protein O6H91_13G014100 [Diphasiastrum complanatum]
MGEGGVEVFETPTKGSNVESKELPDQQEKHEPWRLTGPQPLREEQVQNAVKFLSHPKVKGSPIIYRRSFLEKKGMTKDEIDEAFRRVPDPPSSEAGNVVASQGSAEKRVTTSVTPKVLGPLQTSQQLFAQVALPANSVQSNRFRWTRMFLIIGVFTVAGAGAAVLTKNYILPKFKAWLRHILLEDYESKVKPAQPSPLEEVVSAAAAATAAAAAAREIAAVTRDILSRRNKDRQYFKNMMKALETQTQDLKLTLSSMREAVLSIEKATYKSAACSLPVNGSEFVYDGAGNANVSYKTLGSMQQASNEQKSWEKPGNNSAVSFVSPISKVPDFASMKPASDKGRKNLINNFPSDHERSSIFVETAATSSSSEPWWRRKKSELDYAHSSPNYPTKSNIRITELEPDNDTNTESAGKAYNSLTQPRTSAAAVSSIVTEDRHGWAPPPVPQTVLPGAAAAIRYQKVLVNGYDPTAHLGASPGQSFSGEFDAEPALSLSLEDVTRSDSQRVASPESPKGQELNIIGESILEKPSYKDVVVEEELS